MQENKPKRKTAQPSPEAKARHAKKAYKRYTITLRRDADIDIIKLLDNNEENGIKPTDTMRKLYRQATQRKIISRPAQKKNIGRKGKPMAQISIDNGHSYTTPAEALEAVGMATIVNMMDDDTREAVHADLAPCAEAEFLAAYLERASDDIIIG